MTHNLGTRASSAQYWIVAYSGPAISDHRVLCSSLRAGSNLGTRASSAQYWIVASSGTRSVLEASRHRDQLFLIIVSNARSCALEARVPRRLITYTHA
jgi:hypothetical protein